MNIIKNILIILFVALIIGSIWFLYNSRNSEFVSSKENTTELTVKYGGKPLFLRARIWGVAGNHEQIVLSHSVNKVPDKAVDYIFYTSEVFYRIESDSILVLYTDDSSISEPLNKMQNVKIKGLTSYDEILDYYLNYKKYNLERISVYD